MLVKNLLRSSVPHSFVPILPWPPGPRSDHAAYIQTGLRFRRTTNDDLQHRLPCPARRDFLHELQPQEEPTRAVA